MKFWKPSSKKRVSCRTYVGIPVVAVLFLLVDDLAAQSQIEPPQPIVEIENGEKAGSHTIQPEGNSKHCNSGMDVANHRLGHRLRGSRLGTRLAEHRLWNCDYEYFQYEPNPAPHGLALNCLLDAQILNGKISQLVFFNFQFDWNAKDSDWMLNRSGRRNADKIAWLLREVQSAVKIESIGDKRLDEMRVKLVAKALTERGVEPLPSILVEEVNPKGVTGDEAKILFENRMRDFKTNTGRSSNSVGPSSSTGFGGSGSSTGR